MSHAVLGLMRDRKRQGRRVTAEATVVHLGRRTALAEGRITDAQGRIYATAHSSCLIMRPG